MKSTVISDTYIVDGGVVNTEKGFGIQCGHFAGELLAICRFRT